MNSEKLWTRSFVAACIGNFLLFFAFYLLLPILPLYLMEEFGTSKSAVGMILSCYTLAALFIRPIAGFVLDMFNRKPLYLLAYLLFVCCFSGYIMASTVGLFLLFRVMHGLTFGAVTTAGNSLIVDIMPASRRGEGLGYFGVANNLAMATGPMISLFLHDFATYNHIFFLAIGSGLFGFVFASTIQSNKKVERTLKQPVVLDRFFLPKGLSAAVCLLFLGAPYGMTTTYVAIYGKELGIQSGMGVFFSLMAVGLITSRLFAGKMVDRGKLSKVIVVGTVVCTAGFLLLSQLRPIQLRYPDDMLTMMLFYLVSIILGVGYGMMFPAYNTLFVNLAPNNRRATASSTYLTSWDIGVGVGLVLGGKIADSIGGLSMSYVCATLFASISFLLFWRIAAPHYEKNKLR